MILRKLHKIGRYEKTGMVQATAHSNGQEEAIGQPETIESQLDTIRAIERIVGNRMNSRWL